MMHGYGNNNGYGMMQNYGFYNGGFGILIAIVLLSIIGFAIYKLFDSNQNPNTYDQSLETLKMKYVQGEITEEEYLKRKKIIQNK